MSPLKLLCALCLLDIIEGHSSKAATITNQDARQSAGGDGVENYFQIDRNGRYIMRYETPNGIIHFETGYQRFTASGMPYPVKEGYYIYPTSDGRRVRVAYFADNEGYRVISYDIRDRNREFEEVKYEKAFAELNTKEEQLRYKKKDKSGIFESQF